MIDDENDVEVASDGIRVVPVGPATFGRLDTGRHEVRVPFIDHCRAVARTPDARSADVVGFVPSIDVGERILVATGVGKERQERHASVVSVQKVLRTGTPWEKRSRMSRLALRLTLDVEPM